MQGQLDDITNALGAIHEDVKAMRQEISRLTGKPVLEVMKAYRQSVLKRYLCMLPADVYIEPQGLREGDDIDNPFEDTEKNRVDLRKAAMDFLLSRSGSENARLACQLHTLWYIFVPQELLLSCLGLTKLPVLEV